MNDFPIPSTNICITLTLTSTGFLIPIDLRDRVFVFAVFTFFKLIFWYIYVQKSLYHFIKEQLFSLEFLISVLTCGIVKPVLIVI